MERFTPNLSVGFIGTGVMGKSMVRHLLQGGHTVYVHNRTKGKTEELLQEGAIWEDTLGGIAQKADIVMTMVGYPYDVEQVYLGEGGILSHAKKGTIFIDFTTSTPTLAQRIYNEAHQRGMFALDAPVSGGDIGAKEARLTIMVGGDADIFEICLSIFQLLGTNILLQGPAGSGQHTKMCNQIAIASNMIGVCEALSYARHAGLNPDQVLSSISAGAAGSWSLTNLAPRIIAENFEPGFYVKHFIKDMNIALQEADLMNLNMPGLALAKQMYEDIAKLGEENSGTQALYKYYIKE